MSAWTFLFLSSLFEVLWATCLKFLSFSKMRIISKRYGIVNLKFLYSILPLIGYITFGISNFACFSTAAKTIALTIAYSVWMGLALGMQTLMDIIFLKEKFTGKQYFFLFMVLVGVVGLKLNVK